MKSNKEKVIFRKVFDPFMKIWKYMCIFPDEEANLGCVGCVEIWEENGKWWHDPYCEIHIFNTYKCKIIHKTDEIVPKLINALHKLYDCDFEAVEKITYNKHKVR